MSRLPQAFLPALLCAATGVVLGACPPALAQSPGAGPGVTGGSAPVIYSGGPVSLRVRSYTLLGKPLNFRGSVRRRDARRPVVVERYDSAQNAWVAAASARTDGHGAFWASWRANLSGRITVRAVVAPSGGAARAGARMAQAGDSSDPAEITVYRPAIATIYGPGFFGQRTACGQILQPGMVGVAHRALPCGTQVEVFYGGRTLTVPVIDRGPYANGADWDLTTAAASQLGIDGTVDIGTVTLGRAPGPPNDATAPRGGTTTTLGSATPPADTPAAPVGKTGGASAG